MASHRSITPNAGGKNNPTFIADRLVCANHALVVAATRA
jgi:hypothetical protein